ncbi:MAG: pyrroline-5-carboxylate reductase [Planctomycetota bacterium]|jgi:pyrroline-5-carboxylate reductase|nr:pyrroline-5-carboxylate reductase [Planctomycetota bacterium]
MPHADTIAMIGGGQMALALADGFCRAGLLQPQQIVVSEPHPDARARLEARLPGVRFAQSSTAADEAGLVILAVKPQQAAEACGAIAGHLRPDAVLVSIVAGLSTATLRQLVGIDRIVRVMPNTPCLVGKGVSAICRTPAVRDDSFQRVSTLLAAVGTVHSVDEDLLDAVTGLSGSGPGYIAMVVESLAAGGVAAGLPEPLAVALATETLAGTAALLEQSGEHPAEIRKRVCSPGGTTLAGLATMDEAGVARGLAAGVVAARDRARELGSG